MVRTKELLSLARAPARRSSTTRPFLPLADVVPTDSSRHRETMWSWRFCTVTCTTRTCTAPATIGAGRLTRHYPATKLSVAPTGDARIPNRRSISFMALRIYDESVMQGDRDASFCYRVDHRAHALGYCERWCADGHSNCHVHHYYCVHVRHAHAHGA